MPRSAGLHFALAAASTLLLAAVADVAAAKPLVQSKTKNCGTTNTCVLNISTVPAGVRWVVRQIACLHTFSPRTIAVQIHLLIVQNAGETVGTYPLQPFRLGDSGTTANYADEVSVFINAASGQDIRFIFSISDAPASHGVQCTLSGESFAN